MRSTATKRRSTDVAKHKSPSNTAAVAMAKPTSTRRRVVRKTSLVHGQVLK